jgi:maltose O-acetyltransferase
MRERMLAGAPYNAVDPELDAMHLRARRLLDRFNTTPAEAADERRALLGELFGAVGPGAEVRPPFFCDYGAHITAGERLFMNYDCVILDCNEVQIGDRVLFGPKVQVYTATHPLRPEERAAGWEMAHPITIGDDVWIGGGAIICPGVTIGKGSTIGAGSVVTRDIPPRVFAAGNPCRIIHELP